MTSIWQGYGLTGISTLIPSMATACCSTTTGGWSIGSTTGSMPGFTFGSTIGSSITSSDMSTSSSEEYSPQYKSGPYMIVFLSETTPRGLSAKAPSQSSTAKSLAKSAPVMITVFSSNAASPNRASEKRTTYVEKKVCYRITEVRRIGHSPLLKKKITRRGCVLLAPRLIWKLNSLSRVRCWNYRHIGAEAV